MMTCPHPSVRCINEFELIRKYRCESCGAVMMCACDEAIGRKFLPHQLEFGTDLDTAQRIRVTAGFQPKVCEECRGLPLTPHPKAASYGSKIERYYWRELAFETMKRFDAWLQSQCSRSRTLTEDAEMQRTINREVLEELKLRHKTAPKYTFSKNRQRDIIKKFGVEVVTLKGAYATNQARRRAIIRDAAGSCSVEEFACRHFRSLGYGALIVGNEPIHVLFGLYMSPLVQDVADPYNQPPYEPVRFGDRHAYDARMHSKPIRPALPEDLKQVQTLLPKDFGKRGYAKRRADTIKKHLSALTSEPGGLHRLFDRWLGPSEGLRQYLWAYRNEHIEVARRLINIIPGVAIIEILRYLIEDYWGRYTGWPDLLLWRDDEFLFADVNSAGGKLGENKGRWIRDNHERLHFPYKLIEVLKAEEGSVAA